MRILLVEDDQPAAEYLIRGLTESGHVADQAVDREDGLHLSLTDDYGMLIADRMLPKRDGLTLVRMLRADGRESALRSAYQFHRHLDQPAARQDRS